MTSADATAHRLIAAAIARDGGLRASGPALLLALDLGDLRLRCP